MQVLSIFLQAKYKRLYSDVVSDNLLPGAAISVKTAKGETLSREAEKAADNTTFTPVPLPYAPLSSLVIYVQFS